MHGSHPRVTPPTASGTSPPAVSSSSGQPPWYDVLHVESDTGVAAVTAAHLSRHRLEVQSVRDRETALERLGSGPETRFDCIVSDHRRPMLDGLGLSERVRQRFPDLPLVLFTGERGIERRALEAGADAVVRKTGRARQFETLADRVRAMVAQRH